MRAHRVPPDARGSGAGRNKRESRPVHYKSRPRRAQPAPPSKSRNMTVMPCQFSTTPSGRIPCAEHLSRACWLGTTAIGCGARRPARASRPPTNAANAGRGRDADDNPLAPPLARWKTSIVRGASKKRPSTRWDVSARHAVPTLISTLNDANPRVRAEAARALARIGPEATEAVPALIAQGSMIPRKKCARPRPCALGQVGPAAATAVPALISLIDAASNKQSPANPSTPNQHR